MLKILQARLQQYVNYELPDVQAVFRKGRGIRDRTANTQWIIEKIRRVPEKHLISSLLTMPKSLNVWITINWKILKEMGIPDHLTCPLRNLYEGQEATVRLDMEQQIGSKCKKKYVKAVFCHPAYLTSMQSTS